jgi:hypothetical protein
MMVTNSGNMNHKTNHTKEDRRDYAIYKENHPLTTKTNCICLGPFGYL